MLAGIEQATPRRGRRTLAAGLLAVVVGSVAADTVVAPESAPVWAAQDATVPTSTVAASVGTDPGTATSGPLREERLTAPDRVVVRDDLGVVATFTVGSRSVALRGPQRVFAESTTTATVTTTTWVRLLTQPFTGAVDHGWLSGRLTDWSDDVLELARQYVTGAGERYDASGRRIAGDASYGPLQADGTREEGSDFNDYLGDPWTYGSRVDPPEPEQFAAMDCSGYVRTVYGYRAGVPLSLQPDGVTLPRRAVQMAESAPGVVIVPDTGRRPAGTSTLLPGDLLFFDASTDDGTLVDHVGIYLGLDSQGAPRFLSSRKGADGPTMGDVRGRSTLSGTGLYATSFRSVRRL
jgi:cell wall-associated NlpC family hydrolase